LSVIAIAACTTSRRRIWCLRPEPSSAVRDFSGAYRLGG